MSNIVKKIFAVSICIYLLLGVSSIRAFAAESNPKQIISQEIIDLIKDYSLFRQNNFFSDNDNSLNLGKLPKINYENTAQAVLNDEQIRKQKLKKMADKLEVKVVSAKVTPYIKDYLETNDDVTIMVYEWTFFDYTGATGLVDTAGFGADHEITLTKTDKGLVISQDDYDEGFLTEMKSSTFKPQKIDNVQTVSSSSNDYNNNLINKVFPGEIINPQYIIYYNRDGVASYADQYVYHTTDIYSVYEDSHNQYYKNFNPPNGYGDCASFASQCMYEGGGMPMTSTWYYNNNGTIGSGTAYTDDDTASVPWTSSTNQRNNFKGSAPFGWTCINNPKDSDIKKGNPIYMVWHCTDGQVSDNTTFNHTTICVGTNTSGMPVINCHNNDCYRIPWRCGYKDSGFSTILIPDSFSFI